MIRKSTEQRMSPQLVEEKLEQIREYGAKEVEEIRSGKHRAAEWKFTDCALDFYAGDFEKARKACKNPENSLGWTGTFMRTGLNLFLLYLYVFKKCL